MNHRLPPLLALLATAAGPAIAATAAPGAGFVSLFNGHDLAGWKLPAGDNGHWRVADGVIDYDAASEAPGEKHLLTDASFENFRLHVEWRIKETSGTYTAPVLLPDGTTKRDAAGNELTESFPNADSGILLRGASHQANIWCWPIGSGELWSVRTAPDIQPDLRAAATPRVRADHPVGRWNAFDIQLVDSRISIELNGQRVIDHALIPGLPPRGPIGFQHHGGRDPATGRLDPASSLVQFRNVWIKELPPSGGPPDPEGFRPLLDHALSHWLPAPQRDWSCDGTELRLEPAAADGTLRNHNYLWTAAEYGDFELDFEFLLEPHSNSGLFFRTGDPDDPVFSGLEVQLTNSHGAPSTNRGGTAGAIYDCLAPQANAVRPPGQWNQCRLRCLGPHVSLHLNGSHVIEMDLDSWREPFLNPDGSANKYPLALKDFPRRGRIGLQDHGRPVRFRNLRVKPL